MSDLETLLQQQLHQLEEPPATGIDVLLRHTRAAHRRIGLVRAGIVGGSGVTVAIIAATLASGAGAPSARSELGSRTPTPAPSQAESSSEQLREISLPRWWADGPGQEAARGAITFNHAPQAYAIDGVDFVVVDQSQHRPTEGRSIMTYYDKTSQHQDAYDTASAGVQGSSNGAAPTIIQDVPTRGQDLFVLPYLPSGAATLRYSLQGQAPETAAVVNVVDSGDGHALPSIGAIVGVRPASFSAPQAIIDVLDDHGRVLSTVTADETRLLRFGTQ